MQNLSDNHDFGFQSIHNATESYGVGFQRIQHHSESYEFALHLFNTEAVGRNLGASGGETLKGNNVGGCGPIRPREG